jgi:hypothetical protein
MPCDAMSRVQGARDLQQAAPSGAAFFMCVTAAPAGELNLYEATILPNHMPRS